jgi:hypothetical protein
MRPPTAGPAWRLHPTATFSALYAVAHTGAAVIFGRRWPRWGAGRISSPTRRFGTPGLHWDVMGKRPQIALLLAATSCLLAMMVDWIAAELRRPGKPVGVIPEPMGVAPE